LAEYYGGAEEPLAESNLIMTQYLAARQICFSPITLASACYFNAFIRESFKLKGKNLQMDMATGMAEISC
jgi:hypothetical protein